MGMGLSLGTNDLPCFVNLFKISKWLKIRLQVDSLQIIVKSDFKK